MFDLDKYLADLIMNCRSAFGERLLYMGLQGSWLICRIVTILIRRSLPCSPGVKALLHASNTLEEKSIQKVGQ